MRTLATIAGALAVFAAGITTNGVSASTREFHRCDMRDCMGGGDFHMDRGGDRGDHRDSGRFRDHGFNGFGGFNNFGFFPDFGEVPYFALNYPPDYGPSNSHVAWCLARYRTYNPATNTFFIRRGVPAVCLSPYPY